MQLSHRLYYWMKPALPRRARMMIRRIVARRERAINKEIWPIKESAAVRPTEWPGWPNKKKFAVVLTHDVESAEGLAQVQRLAELEMSLGFRSSFNFIPLGTYTVSQELRDWLTERGFEVGVHDLEHNGRLFQSQRGFAKKAVEINKYLDKWNAVGFRGGFMLRNLEWLHQLEIEYDASTFDTDPFELQSDGADTIFPHWISRSERTIVEGSSGKRDLEDMDDSQRIASSGCNFANKGYVELPYTLPQDSTLFLVLEETTSRIWLQKADWLAEKGGMVLVNVHPDYIDFSGRSTSSRTYPASRYTDLLQHFLLKHHHKFWCPLPKEMATWYKQARTIHGLSCLNGNVSDSKKGELSNLKRKRAAVLLYSEYPADPRPRRAAEAMIEAGMDVDLLCVAGSPSDLRTETQGGVRITRLPIKRSRDSKLGYLGKYARFISSSFWFLARKGFRSRYDVIHVHNMPDVLVFSTLLSKAMGAKVILDLHDPMPEVMMTIYGLNEKRLSVRMLKQMEKWSIGLADRVITVNKACKRIFASRSCSINKIRVIMNSPDEQLFYYQEPLSSKLREAGKPFVVMYHGSIVERHGLDIAVDAFQRVLRTFPNTELRIYGNETPFLKKVMNSVATSKIAYAIKYLGPKPLEQIVTAIRDCDVGIVPNRRSIFTELNTPTRIFEYLSQGKAVIAPRAPGILDYFGPDDLIYFNLGDADDLAAKLEFVLTHPAIIQGVVARGQGIYRTHLWTNEKHQFVNIIAETLGLATAQTNGASESACAPFQVER